MDSCMSVLFGCPCSVGILSDFSHALLQDNNGMIIGAEVKDNLSGKKRNVYAKQVINATGPFTDGLRQMSDPSKPSIIMPSAGLSPSPHRIACSLHQSYLPSAYPIYASWSPKFNHSWKQSNTATYIATSVVLRTAVCYGCSHSLLHNTHGQHQQLLIILKLQRHWCACTQVCM